MAEGTPPPSRLRGSLQHMARVAKQVPGVGFVYTFWRHTKDPDKYLERYVETIVGNAQRVNAWIMWREKTASDWFRDRDSVKDVHTIVIRGIMSFAEPGSLDQQDEESGTGAVFTDTVEAMREEFRKEPNRCHTMGGTAFKSSPLRCDVEDLRAFGQHLCHYCELRCTVEERESVPSRDGLGL